MSCIGGVEGGGNKDIDKEESRIVLDGE